MSYLFDGANDRLTGTFTSTYNAEGVTLAAFVKVTAHPIAVDSIIQFGNSSSSDDQSHWIVTSGTDNHWLLRSRTTISVSADRFENIDGIWAAIVGVITNDSLRDIYVNGISNTAQSTGTQAVADVLQFVRLGEDMTGAQDFTGRIAEVAIWNAALNSSQITSYIAGTAASGIAAANLIGYWPLSASASPQLNLGIDSGGDLTVTGAVFDADHPTISQGLDPIRLIWRI